MSTLQQHVSLKKNEDRRILSGHQWVFSNEILYVGGNPQSGDVVEILRSDGKTLGIGFYNPHSLIAVRFLSSSIEEITKDFFKRRISSAYQLRKKIFPESETFRMVYGESDFLPGLIVDKYNEYLSVQTFSAGMDNRLPMIYDALEELFSPKGIVERNESPLRELEHIPERSALVRGTVDPIMIDLDGIKFTVDILNGQKSGFFLDQRENRKMISPFVKDAAVLDCFCNEGGFGLYAARFGAKSVDSVDISETAIERARENARLNELKQIQFHTEDVFKFLERAAAAKKQWDVVILDPPSFTKSRKTVTTAIKGYKEINTNGLSVTKKGGFFISVSCSHHIDRDSFLKVINESSVKAGKRIKILRISSASPDHPILPSMPETQYLKFVLCSVE